jgi:hypothetical protein
MHLAYWISNRKTNPTKYLDNWSSKKKRTKTLFLPSLSSSISTKLEWLLYFNSSRKIRRLHPSQQLQKNQKQNLQNLFLSLWVSISSSRNKKSFSPSLALPLFAEKKIRNKAALSSFVTTEQQQKQREDLWLFILLKPTAKDPLKI